jgi:hypothetical protein
MESLPPVIRLVIREGQGERRETQSHGKIVGGRKTGRGIERKRERDTQRHRENQRQRHMTSTERERERERERESAQTEPQQVPQCQP